jgi:hypothetical protein
MVLLFWAGSSLLSRDTLADWIKNAFWEPSISYRTDASIFVTAETTLRFFMPVVTLYYLRVAA